MTQLSQLEINSLKTQAELMKDIIRNYKDITYSIHKKAEELRKLLHTKTMDPSVPNPDISISYEVYDNISDALIDLSDQSKWHKLGILAKSAVPDNQTKLKILEQLTKDI